MTQKVTDAKEQQAASAQQVNIFAAKEIANFINNVGISDNRRKK